MSPETKAISANFDLILSSIRGAAVAQSGEALKTGLLARGDLSTVKPSSAEMPTAPSLSRHENAHEDFLMNSFGRCDE